MTKADLKWIEIKIGAEIEEIDWPLLNLLWVTDVNGVHWLSRDQGQTFERYGRSERRENMISGDLIPSYLLKIVGTLMMFCAIFAKDDLNRIIFLAIAYFCVSAAWYIANHHANRWLRLWKGREL